MIEWTTEDDHKAKRQGWALFSQDDFSCRLQKLDDPEAVAEEIGDSTFPGRTFEADEDALAYVQGRADCGDEHAKKALAFVEQENTPEGMRRAEQQFRKKVKPRNKPTKHDHDKELTTILKTPDVYTFTVRVWRSFGDDLAVIEEKHGNKPVEEALKAQLIEELQDAYDKTGIDGGFTIIDGPSVPLNWKDA